MQAEIENGCLFLYCCWLLAADAGIPRHKSNCETLASSFNFRGTDVLFRSDTRQAGSQPEMVQRYLAACARVNGAQITLNALSIVGDVVLHKLRPSLAREPH